MGKIQFILHACFRYCSPIHRSMRWKRDSLYIRIWEIGFSNVRCLVYLFNGARCFGPENLTPVKLLGFSNVRCLVYLFNGARCFGPENLTPVKLLCQSTSLRYSRQTYLIHRGTSHWTPLHLYHLCWQSSGRHHHGLVGS